MNGNSILLDTNIVLYFLNGEESLIPLLEEKNIFLSFISQIELLGARNIDITDMIKIKQFISECTVIDITSEIKEHTIQIRRNYNVKLPDSIILATSLWLNMPLLTADKDFAKFDFADIIFFKK